MKSIVVIGREYFDRFGNAFQSAEVVVDGILLAQLPFSRGYDTHCLYKAFEWLAENGYLEFANGNSPVECAKQLGVNLYHVKFEDNRP